MCYLDKEGIKPGVLCQTSVLASYPCGNWTTQKVTVVELQCQGEPMLQTWYVHENTANLMKHKPDEKALLLNTKKKKSPGMVSAVNLRTNRGDVAARVHRHGN